MHYWYINIYENSNKKHIKHK